IANLRAWAASAPWTDEADGDRRLISSDTGDGLDAARIILPETIEYLAGQLSAQGRVLVGIPERHLLAAAPLPPGDPRGAGLFCACARRAAGAGGGGFLRGFGVREVGRRRRAGRSTAVRDRRRSVGRVQLTVD